MFFDGFAGALIDRQKCRPNQYHQPRISRQRTKFAGIGQIVPMPAEPCQISCKLDGVAAWTVLTGSDQAEDLKSLVIEPVFGGPAQRHRLERL